MYAKSLQELNHIIHIQQKERYLKTSCQIQLQKNKIPWACYQWIHLKKVKKETKSSLISYFDEKCQIFSTKLVELKFIQTALNSPHLSLFCRKILEGKAKTMEYQLRDLQPAFLFNWHLKKEF